MEKYFVDMYNFPFLLAGEYYKKVLALGDQAIGSQHIMKLTHMFKHHEDHQETVRTVFDRRLNLPRLYPPYQANAVNRGVSYNQYDLFYLILSNIATLSSAASLNKSGQDFVQLNDYLKPSFDTMMNSTKHQFHSTLRSSLKGFRIEQIIVIIVLGVVLLLAGSCIGYQVFTYHRNMRDVLDIIVQFSNS